MKMKSQKFNQIPTSPPRTLKDFLSADSAIAVPRPHNTTPFSAFHAILNALKNIHFPAAVKSSSKRTPAMCGEIAPQPQIKLNAPTIKDIIRWKSFRDLPELDTSTQTATTTTSATSSPIGSSGSSWCGSDSTAEYLPWWRDGNSEENGMGGKKCSRRVGEENAETATEDKSEVGPESPISVMEKTFEEEWLNSSYDQQYFIVEAISLEKWISRVENNDFEEEEGEEEMKDIEVKQKVWQLYNCIVKNQANSSVSGHKESEKRLIMDFIKQELIKNEEFDNEEDVIRRVQEWINGEDKLWIGWDKKEGYVRQMDKNGTWTKFEGEKQEMGTEIEDTIMDFLVHELLIDIVTSNS